MMSYRREEQARSDEHENARTSEVTHFDSEGSDSSVHASNSCGADDASVNGWAPTPSVWSADESQEEPTNDPLASSNQNSAARQHCQAGFAPYPLTPLVAGMPWSVYGAQQACMTNTSWPGTEQYAFSGMVFLLSHRRLRHLVDFLCRNVVTCGASFLTLKEPEEFGLHAAANNFLLPS